MKTAEATTQDALDLLRQDHDAVDKLFKRFEKLGDDEEGEEGQGRHRRAGREDGGPQGRAAEGFLRPLVCRWTGRCDTARCRSARLMSSSTCRTSSPRARPGRCPGWTACCP